MTKEEILTAIREAAEKLGHPPTFPQLEDMTPMRRRDIRKHFRSFTGALEESGVGVGDNCRRIPDEALFEEWATVARKLKKVPSITQFDDRSKYTVAPYQGRFRHWSRVPEKMREYAKTHGLMEEWQDVMELIRRKDEEGLAAAADGRPRSGLREPEIRKDRPMYGPLMAPAPLLHEPINELGVVFCFGTVAARLGFMVTLIQAAFPDCEAFRVVAPGRLQRVKIEFEQESRNFLKHGHNVNDCDMIVCWEHNWPECPLEVLELRTLLEIGRSGDRKAEPYHWLTLITLIGKGKSKNLTTDGKEDCLTKPLAPSRKGQEQRPSTSQHGQTMIGKAGAKALPRTGADER